MDCKKTGELILNLRKEKKMTQKEVADAIFTARNMDFGGTTCNGRTKQ